MLVWLAVVAAVEPSQNLRARLQDASTKLGNVAEGLLSVQSDVNRVERESLGKVFDLQTLRTFFAAHQRIQSENDALKASSSTLEARIKELEAQKAAVEIKAVNDTAIAQQTLDLSEQKSHGFELDKLALDDRLKSSLAEKEKINATLTKELAATGALRSTIATQQDTIKHMQEQVVKLTTEKDTAAKVHLAKMAALSAGQKALEDQLQLQHNYGIECHSKLMQAQQKLGNEAVDVSGLKALQDALDAQKRMTSDLTSRTESLMQQVTQKDLELSQVKYQSGKEVLNLKSSLGALETHSTAMETTLKEANKARVVAEKEVMELKKTLLSTSTAELEHQVAVLQGEVQHTSEALKSSQMEEAKAKSTAQQAQAYQHAAELTAKLNAEAAKNAAKIAEDEVKKAAQRSLAAQTSANEANAKAESALSEQCEVEWKSMNEGYDKLKQDYATCEAGLLTAEAQVKLLSQSVQAR
jgi:chromosome segregation ATPase